METFFDRIIRMAIPAAPLIIVAMMLAISSTTNAASPFIVAISGDNGSSQDELAQQVVASLNANSKGAVVASLLVGDNYITPKLQPKKFYRNGAVDFSHASVFNAEKLALHLQALRAGMPVPLKRGAVLTPTPVVVVSGRFLLSSELEKYIDLKAFVDVDQRFVVELAATRDEVTIPLPRTEAEVVKVAAKLSALVADGYVKKTDGLKRAYKKALTNLKKISESNFVIAGIDDVTPTQLEIGFTNLAKRNERVEAIVRESTSEADLALRLENFLASHPVPAMKRGDRLFILDHHHLSYVFRGKGLSQLYLEVVKPPADFDLARLKLRNQQGAPLTWDDLRNNPYRSLVGLLQTERVIKKTGVPHEEFAWARYFQKRFEKLRKPLTEQNLLDPASRAKAISLASKLAARPEARKLLSALGPAPARNTLLCKDLFR